MLYEVITASANQHATQEHGVGRYYRGPYIGLEMLQSLPCAPVEAKAALQVGDHPLDSGSEIAQTFECPQTFCHITYLDTRNNFV